VAEKTISVAELLELAQEGAEIEHEPKRMVVEQFNDLVASLRQMVDNEKDRIESDLKRNQTNLEILATLQALIRKEENRNRSGSTTMKMDLQPIRQMLMEFLADREERARTAYEFDIRRDGRGFAQSILATPVGQKPSRLN
jgi:uncharacterized protein (DUF934 family)